jgi:negative regulator of sigma-B (phosphoserine phosphatase)
VKLTIAHRVTPAAGEISSGDAALIRDDGGTTLVALIDVLGHGREAAQVADLAVRHLTTARLGAAVEVVQGLHDALRGTRGAAAAVCLLRDGRIDGCAVGNVEVRVLGSPVPVMLTPGIIGHRMHRLRDFGGKLAAGDRVVCFSDGVLSQTPFAELRKLPPTETCAVVMTSHRRSYDDASVVVVDVVSVGGSDVRSEVRT